MEDAFLIPRDIVNEKWYHVRHVVVLIYLLFDAGDNGKVSINSKDYASKKNMLHSEFLDSIKTLEEAKVLSIVRDGTNIDIVVNNFDKYLAI